jgi:hypothetical protein
MRRRWAVAVLFAALQGLTLAAPAQDGGETAPWSELEPELPALPKAEGLVELYVTAASTNRFFVDPSSVSVGNDGVVRYVVSVRSPAGAISTNYEGIRCDAGQRRLYAFGRPDNTWSKAKTANWTRISNAGANRYAYTLMREYFCPGGVAIRNAAEGVNALRRGGHPDVERTHGS